MYTVIAVREPKNDEDGTSNGHLIFHVAETIAEVHDIIKVECQKQCEVEWTEPLRFPGSPRPYGNWGFVILEDGIPVEVPGYIGDIDITSNAEYWSDSTIVDIHKLKINAYSLEECTKSFLKDLHSTERDTLVALTAHYREVEKIEKEKDTLRELMEKYPELVGGYNVQEGQTKL